jgi:hypothetical protein
LKGTRSEEAPVEGQHELFGFLTTEANATIAPIHPKAMPESSTVGWGPIRSTRWRCSGHCPMMR